MLASLLAVSLMMHAPDSTAQARFGSVTGAVESNSALYLDDPVLGPAQSRFGSNNYLKLDWQRDSLSAGLQAEWYPRALAGYPSELSGAGLTGLYLDWRCGLVQLHAGSFFEQLGSGILLRSWEDRELGMNNGITGAYAAFHTRGNGMRAKVFGGFPKFGVWPTLQTAIAGADLSLDLLSATGSGNALLLEGSFTDKIARSTEDGVAFLAQSSGFTVPAHVPGVSARVQYSSAAFSVKAECVWKGDDYYVEQLPKAREQYRLKGGNAQIIEASAAVGPFSGTLTARRLENMSSRIFHTTGSPSVANTLNYLPSLCMQQTYMLAGLNPYETYADGEAGLQGDLYWTFRRGTVLGGRYGMKLHVGGSWIMALPCALPDRDAGYLAYRDINIDLERRWNRNFRTVLFVSIQENSPTHGNRKATNAQNVFVLDGQYRFSSATSLRLELQYLYSEELTRDWMAALAELSFAPHWSITVSDMYNHGSTGVHYYNVGASYSLSSLNISLMAGRSREGMVCSGGVCRWQPAFAGGVLRVQWSF